MKKPLWITTYRPGHSYPSVYDDYDKALEHYDPESQFLLKVEAEVPEPEETLVAEEVVTE